MSSIRLYHVTNRQSAERMASSAMGLDEQDYQAIYDAVKDYLNVPCSYLVEQANPPLDEHARGAVAFYGTYREAATNRAVAFNKTGYRGPYVEGLVRRAASFIAQPYTLFQEVVDHITGGSTEPVVVTVDLPITLLKYPDQIGCLEHYITLGKVASEYIRDIRAIDQ